MKHYMIGARVLAALLLVAGAAGLALPVSAGQLPPVLINAGLITEKAGAYHIEMTSTFGGKTMTSSGDMELSTPMKMRMTTNTEQGVMQMIVLAPDSYMKMGNAPWKKYPGNPSDYSQMDIKNFLNKDKDDYTSTDLGMQLKDGQMLHAYKITNQTKKSTQTVFIDSAGRLARMEVGPMTMTLSKFGEPLSIQPPL